MAALVISEQEITSQLGTVLAQIRPQDLKNQVDESAAQVRCLALAQHTQAEQDFNRAKVLYATQSLTKPDYDQAQARFDSTLAAVSQAKAALRQTQITLGDSDLKAPFAGYILARSIDVGTLASPSTAAFTIADTSQSRRHSVCRKTPSTWFAWGRRLRCKCRMILPSMRDVSPASLPAPMREAACSPSK